MEVLPKTFQKGKNGGKFLDPRKKIKAVLFTSYVGFVLVT